MQMDCHGYDSTGFRCCYCYHMNEARKHRPNAPRLNLDTTVESSADDCPEDSLPSDSDSDEGASIHCISIAVMEQLLV